VNIERSQNVLYGFWKAACREVMGPHFDIPMYWRPITNTKWL